MGKGNFREEFKRDAVASITKRTYRLADVTLRLGMSQHSLYAWKKMFAQPAESGGEWEFIYMVRSIDNHLK